MGGIASYDFLRNEFMRYLTLSGLILAAGVLLSGCAPPQQSRALKRLPDPLRTPPPSPRYEASPPPPRPVAPPRPTSHNLRGRHIVVDPGHGGKDPGASSRYTALPEKAIVLSVSLALAEELKGRGARVTMTRARDMYVSLDRRAEIAEQSKADLFVSIHADSASRASAAGTGLYIARNASPESVRAAIRMESTLKRMGIPCRGVQRKGFRVLVGHSRPALLIETGFLSNRGDALQLANAAYRTKIAQVIAEGITVHLTAEK